MARKIVRFSVNLEASQRDWVRLFAVKAGINASIVVRALLYKLQTEPEFAREVIELIFDVPEEEAELTPETEEEQEVPPTPSSQLKKGQILYDSNGQPVILE